MRGMGSPRCEIFELRTHILPTVHQTTCGGRPFTLYYTYLYCILSYCSKHMKLKTHFVLEARGQSQDQDLTIFIQFRHADAYPDTNLFVYLPNNLPH